MTVEYRVLGPLEVLLDGEPVAVPAGRGRVLLATLLLRANEFVSVDELVERVWDGEPPAPDRAHKTLQTVVLRLRQSLGAANCVRTSSRGYTAEVAPGQLDLARFRELVAQGEHRAALELWRGPVLGNVTSESLHRDDVPRLVEEQVVALESRIDEDLARPADLLVPELWSLVRQHPLRETFWAQLMLALHRAGRQAEALSAYQEIRGRLADELGVDPGQRLREAHAQVLSGETPASPVVPRQLPPAYRHFAGREHELARLTEIAGARPGEPVLISAINGIGGVGKTALAVQWAHQVADRFPDGQLHVNLRGFDLRAEPLDPVAVARDFLVALGVPGNELPGSDEAVLAEYRSLLARRRVLVVLDNARDVEQVRPLLPGGAGNLVLVTSRNRLSGLVAREGAQPVALDVMDERAAIDLLTERIGAARTAAEPDAVARLVKRCAGLPLALGIVAARAAYGDPLTALATELEQERLDALDIDDPTTGVRHVFSWSLRSVSEAAARLFVMLGSHPGPEFTVEAAASLSAVPRAESVRGLNELVAGSLVTRTHTGRFLLHDLLRDYAAERFNELSRERQAEAQQRMFDHYLHTSLDANLRIEVKVIWTPLAPPSPAAVIVPMPDTRAARKWFRVEYPVLLGVLREMVAAGADDLVWRLGYTLHLPLLRSGMLVDAEETELLALDAARRRNDILGQSRLHRSLGGVYIAKQMFFEAELHLQSALRLEEERGNVNGQADVSRGLAHVYEKLGQADRGLEILSRVHPRIAELSEYQRACYLEAYGRAHHQAGDRERAIELCLEAKALFFEVKRQSMPSANNFETLGDVHLELGRYAEAVENYHASVEVLRALEHRQALGDAIVRLARAHIAAGEPAVAQEQLTEALALYEEFGRAEAAEVRELIASVTNV
ncbi:BTAD domain-containing putative transcriptional regulator [Lentzea sp. BCCO 10_0061]|uniref:BTAD domain-containing putative transcriptional regulator n=1 Tax=Lentzea sokolovensis TaxID=3095429 RepID=A0ABU4V8X6_9PSEU|nr:BTAD domain-containing putative transcriptional regulator [Lentzea sp. BCCO 10_0061]MDX8148256.1 BTAD domain-containing putative transcriptional regulator [Lentzea sp. BCCO 10_0061]